jgi:esterase/lipase
MGGTLAIIGAAEHTVGRLVLIAPYFGLAVGGQWTSRATAWLKWVLPVLPKLAKGQISDPQGYRAYETGSYLVSLRAFEQLAELAEIAKRKLPDLALPILVFASENDTVASFKATERLLRGCRRARLVACDRSNHVLTYDFDRERIMMETAAFLSAEASPAPTAD